MKKLIIILILFPSMLVAQNDSLRLAQIDVLNNIRTNPYKHKTKYFVPRSKALKVDSILMEVAQRRAEYYFGKYGFNVDHQEFPKVLIDYQETYLEVNNKEEEEKSYSIFSECLGAGYTDIRNFFDSKPHAEILGETYAEFIGVGIVTYNNIDYICVLTKN